jgi:hypothetical protein
MHGKQGHYLEFPVLENKQMHNGLTLSLQKKLIYFRYCSKLGMDLSRAPYKGIKCFPTHRKVLPRELLASSTEKISFYM